MTRQWEVRRRYADIPTETELFSSGELLREFPHLRPFSEVIRDGGTFRINWTLEHLNVTIKEKY